MSSFLNNDQRKPNLIDGKNRRSVALPIYLYASLSLLWLYSGIIPVLFSKSESLNLLAQLGIPESLLVPVLMSSSLLDILFGLLILSHYRFHSVLWMAQLSVVVTYSVIIALAIPENWVHPFGPLIKNVPIMALLLFMVHSHSLNAKQDAINRNN